MPLDNSTLLPISNVLDISTQDNLKVNSPEFKAFLGSITEKVNSLLTSVNAKDIGAYTTKETLAGQNYFDNDGQDRRPVYRKVVDFGALHNAAGNKQVAHGLDAAWPYKFTRIYAVASDPTNRIFIPIPYATATAIDIIELFIDDTYVNITVGKDRSVFTTTYVVMEYCEI